MTISRVHLGNRKSSVADRYLKAIEDAEASPSQFHDQSPDPQWRKDANISMSVTASLSGSSRTPTPVRSQSRSSWQSRVLASSPTSPMDPPQSTLSRIRLFPATTPVSQNEEDTTTDGSSLMTPRTSETPSSGPLHSSPDTTVVPIGMRQLSESSSGWRKRLEGTSRAKKISSTNPLNDSSWVKKKGSPRRLGASPRTIPRHFPPESLTAISQMEHQKKIDPSSAPTEVMMNLSSAQRLSDEKSDFGGATTEIATNRFVDRDRKRLDEAPSKKLSYGTVRTRREDQCTAGDHSEAVCVDESIEYALHQHLMYRQQGKGSSQNVEATTADFQAGRLRRHVYNHKSNLYETSDSSFQSKSLTSSVGVETGGRTADKTQIALRRVFEQAPQLNETKNRIHLVDFRYPDPQSTHGDREIADRNLVNLHEGSIDHTLRSDGGRKGRGAQLRTVVFDAKAHSLPLQGHENQTDPDSSGSSGSTPIVVSSTGMGQEDFRIAMSAPDKNTIQFLFSPDRVNQQVVDMIEFGPPSIKRTRVIADEMETSEMKLSGQNQSGTITDSHDLAQNARFGNPLWGKDANEINAKRVSPLGVNARDNGMKKSVLDHRGENDKNRVCGDGDQTHVEVDQDESQNDNVSSLVQSRIKAFSMSLGASKGVDGTRDVTESSAAFGPKSSDASGTGKVLTIEACRALSNPADRVSASAIKVGVRPPNGSTNHGKSFPPTLPSSIEREDENGKCIPLSHGEKKAPNDNVSSLDARPVETHLMGTRVSGTRVSMEGASVLNSERCSNGMMRGELPRTNEPHRAGKTNTLRRVPEAYKAQLPRKDKDESQSGVKSVMMMKNLFEPQVKAVEADSDEDAATSESVDVKSIRSIFEEAQESQLKVNEENAVTKIRTMFERSAPQPQIGRTHLAVRKLESKSRKQSSKLPGLANQPAGTRVATRLSVAAVRKIPADKVPNGDKGAPPSKELTQSNGQSKSDQPAPPWGASISEQIQRIDVLRARHIEHSVNDVALQSSLPSASISSKGSVRNGNGDELPTSEISSEVSPQHEEKVAEAVSTGKYNIDNRVTGEENREEIQANGFPSKCNIPAPVLQHDYGELEDGELGYQLQGTKKHEPRAAQVCRKTRERDAGKPSGGIRNENRQLAHAHSNLVTEKGIIDNELRSCRATNEGARLENHSYQSTIQGVVVRKPMKPDSSKIVYETRTDSEGYDDGVTLDLSIAEVSCLTNPTCLHSKEDQSLDGASSRISKDVEVFDGRGRSEASSSQTSEAAAPLLALSMRAKFTNSSDDFGYFSQRSFGDRLSSDPQAKWIALTTSIEENAPDAVEHTEDPSDPAWDLRIIKAKFTERQSKKVSKKSAFFRDRPAGKTPFPEKSKVDRWVPFESFNFPEATIALNSIQHGVKVNQAHLPEKSAARLGSNTMRGLDSATSLGNPPHGSEHHRVVPQTEDKCAPLDPPSMGLSMPNDTNLLNNNASIQNADNSTPPQTEPYSHHKALMSKLMSLREARLRRTNAFSRKSSSFGGSRAGLPFQKPHVLASKHLSMTAGARFDDEQSASTVSSTRFGGRKFVDCLEVD